MKNTRNSIFQKQRIFNQDSGQRQLNGVVICLMAVLFLTIAQLVTLIPVFAAEWIDEKDLEKYPNILYYLLVTFSFVILITMLWVKLFEGRSAASSGMKLEGLSLNKFTKWFAIGLLMSSFIVCFIWVFGGYKKDEISVFYLTDIAPLSALLLGFIIQSLAEEYLFRGWLLSRLAEKYSLFASIIISSGIFSLMHLPLSNFSQTSHVMMIIGICVTFLFSIFLSLIVIKSGSVWEATAWHAAWNWCFIGGFGLATTGLDLGLNPVFYSLTIKEDSPHWLSGGNFGPEWSIIAMFSLVAGSAVMWRKMTKAPGIEIRSQK